MSADNIARTTHGQPGRDDLSPDAGLLTTAPGWEVRRSPTTGEWSTAEWYDRSVRSGWRIGLTPIRPGVVAAMLWSGDILVDHARGTEAATYARAHRWIGDVTGYGGVLPG
ncbi:hypothetical protein AB0F91_37065 [Amycolatopsis sp. NPDC023774]|uniref:hypothetical protein n=1 Tax=Amycolatopsis sp. NPDC023774 TaxID=3155015 RepID=UPI0033E0B3BE